MFKALHTPKALLGSMLLISLLTGCGDDKKEDASPKEYKVQVRYNATNLRPSGKDVRPGITIALTNEKEDALKGGIIAYPSFVDSYSDETDVENMIATDKVMVELEFVDITTKTKAQALPSNTAITAEILVDGAVKRTIKLDKTTPFNTGDANLHVEQTIKVGDL